MANTPPFARYLASFDPYRLFHMETDCLVLGSGIAGLSAALTSATEQNQVLVLTKKLIQETNTYYAQGGIASCLSEEDSIENHIQDTLKVGQELCNEAVVRFIIEQAPNAVDQLLQWGVEFDQATSETLYQVQTPLHRKGLALTKEGGHSFSRILHARGDATGSEIQDKLTKKALAHPRIQIQEKTYVLDLLTLDHYCLGVVAYRSDIGVVLIWAKKTILASGGGAYLYRETTNPQGATSDGAAMFLRAGGRLLDMEFFQFHPTALYLAGAPRVLISEAVRGEGAYLLDKNGKRFMMDYHPDGELAPRDIVSRSIVQQQEKTQDNCAYLSLQHLDATFARQRFPSLNEICSSFSLDFTKDPIPVRPAAHYMIGGIESDILGQSSLKNLFICGEATCNGFHGANRLASNSLLEGIVYGCVTGKQPSIPYKVSRTEIASPCRKPPYEAVDYADMNNSIRSLLWYHVGINRTATSLEKALKN
jgi:L-aspartate oxidase